MLRANCAGRLAKDESYGFLLADLVLGALIPHEKAIALGEKLRKENKKIKNKRGAFRDGRSRELAKLEEAAREEAGKRWDRNRDEFLAAACAAILPIPTRGAAAAGVREETKKEEKESAPPKLEP
jgi:hypothetical protein